MLLKNSNLFRYLFLLAAVFFTVNPVFAQDKKDDKDDDDTDSVTILKDAPSLAVGYGDGIGDRTDDDEQITGATVRGKVVYDDTGRPARYVMVALAEDKKDSSSRYSLKYAKTDENGDFVLKNIKAGTYVPYIKSDGVLNLDSFNFSFSDRATSPVPVDFFQKITVGGLGEFLVEVRAKRGGAVSGRISYADGEAAVGVRVEVLRKSGERYENTSTLYGGQVNGTVTTDDRGVYRLAMLPAGTYIVRVIEPVSHSQNTSPYDNSRMNQSSTLQTYFPEGEDMKKAKEIEITYAQEQTAIDITLPERQLFDISGIVIQKGNKQPIAKADIKFFRTNEDNQSNIVYSGGNGTASAKSGNWTLQNLPKGKYRIQVSQGYTYQTNNQTNQPQQEFSSVTKDIEITDKNLENLVFELPLGGSIEGAIKIEGDKPVPQYLQLWVVNEETGESSFMDYNYSQSRDQNSQQTKQKPFRFGKLKEGKYRITTFGRGFYIKSISGSGGDGLLEVKEGEKLKGVQIVLATDLGTVKGKVTDFDGQQAFIVLMKAGATVDQANSQAVSDVIKPNGDFEIKAPPGEYSIFVFLAKNRPNTEAEFKEWLKKTLEDAPKVTVKANEATTTTLSMPK